LQTKKCSKCKEIKPISEFRYTRRGDYFHYRGECHECELKWGEEYRKDNVEKIKHSTKEYRKKNPGKVKEWKRRWGKKNYKNNKEKILKKGKEQRKNRSAEAKQKAKERTKKWAKDNPEKVKVIRKRFNQSEKGKKRNREDAIKWRKINRNRLSNNISRAMRSSLKKGKEGRHWEDLVGYTLQDLIEHIEKQFKKGMSWNNYNKTDWNIDHIIPLDSWKFSSYKDREFKQCWALANLQPLWASENFVKSNKIIHARLK